MLSGVSSGTLPDICVDYRWADLIADIRNTPNIFDDYFLMNSSPDPGQTGLLRMQRVCINQRHVIRRHFERSARMKQEYAERGTLPGAVDTWPALQGLYIDGSTNLCQNVAGCSDVQPDLCGCTHTFQITAERKLFHPVTGDETTTSITRTPLTVAMDLLLGPPTVALNDFLGPPSTGGGGRVVSGRIPAYRYSKIQIDPTNSKIKSSVLSLDAQAALAILAADPSNTNFRPRDPLMCKRVDITQYTQGRSCIGSSGAEDPLIKAAEDAFPGGITALEASRAKPAYLVISMGRDTSTRAAAISAFVNTIYNNQITPPLGTAAYLDSKTYPESANHGTMVLDLSNDRLANLAYRGPISDRKDSSGQIWTTPPINDESPYPTMDSFCGLSGTNTRNDRCGNWLLNTFLRECGGSGNTGTTASSITDYRNGQTCIHDHSCVLSLMPRTSGAPPIGRRFVRAPGWNLLLHPNAVERWPDTMRDLQEIKHSWCSGADCWSINALQVMAGVYGPWLSTADLKAKYPVTQTVPWKDELPILELWRLHGNPAFPSKFHLPVGVFLQTWRSDLGSNNIKVSLFHDDPTYDWGHPSSSLGMWQMCPHSSSATVEGALVYSPGTTQWATNEADAHKSRLMTAANPQNFAVDSDPYQHPAQQHDIGLRDNFCNASIGGIKECTVNGFRSYRYVDDASES